MKKTKIMQRILSMLLAFSMLLVYYPVAVGAETSSAGAGGGYEKVVDAQKLDGWKEFFGPDILSTQNAGGVWTDKSVFTDASAFPAGTIECVSCIAYTGFHFAICVDKHHRITSFRSL